MIELAKEKPKELLENKTVYTHYQLQRKVETPKTNLKRVGDRTTCFYTFNSAAKLTKQDEDNNIKTLVDGKGTPVYASSKACDFVNAKYHFSGYYRNSSHHVLQNENPDK